MGLLIAQLCFKNLAKLAVSCGLSSQSIGVMSILDSIQTPLLIPNSHKFGGSKKTRSRFDPVSVANIYFARKELIAQRLSFLSPKCKWNASVVKVEAYSYTRNNCLRRRT